jgi:hypothetical protein
MAQTQDTMMQQQQQMMARHEEETANLLVSLIAAPFPLVLGISALV